MHTLTIEPKNQADYRLFVDLAKRLKVKFKVSKALPAENEMEAKFFSLAGSFDLPETSGELTDIIKQGHENKEIDTSWIQ